MEREEAGKGPYDSMHVWQSHMVCMHHGGRKLNQGNGNLIEDTLSTNRKNSHPCDAFMHMPLFMVVDKILIYRVSHISGERVS